MAGRPRNFNEIELIDKATEVFWKKGYNNASAKDLMDAMQIGQGSFYGTFKGGKKELFKKSLSRVWKLGQTQISDGVKQAQNPINFIKTFFLSMVERPTNNIQKGCFGGNTLVEFSNVDDELKILAIELLNQLGPEFEKALLLAQERGYLDKNKSPKILAQFLLNLWNGANVTLRMNQNKEAYKTMIEMNLKILD